MTRPATARLKFNPPLGRMPVLQFCAPGELRIDPTYQRSVESEDSQRLIRKIAQHWNWDLCLPLVVSRREGGELLVIDGQHRLEAARLRGDIAHLPCVVGEYASSADEAASFVHLNQQRRPLSRIDVFKAALASEDAQTVAIAGALDKAGLSLAPHGNYLFWKPGMIGNVGGIEMAWRKHGAAAVGEALECLSTAFAGEVLKYAGTLFPGLVAVCGEEIAARGSFEPGRFAAFTARLGGQGQGKLVRAAGQERLIDPRLGRVAAVVRVITELHWPERKQAREALARKLGAGMVAAGAQPDPRPALNFEPDHAGMCWCEQCEMRVSRTQAEGCRSRWCSLRQKVAA